MFLRDNKHEFWREEPTLILCHPIKLILIFIGLYTGPNTHIMWTCICPFRRNALFLTIFMHIFGLDSSLLSPEAWFSRCLYVSTGIGVARILSGGALFFPEKVDDFFSRRLQNTRLNCLNILSHRPDLLNLPNFLKMDSCSASGGA